MRHVLTTETTLRLAIIKAIEHATFASGFSGSNSNRSLILADARVAGESRIRDVRECGEDQRLSDDFNPKAVHRRDAAERVDALADRRNNEAIICKRIGK